MSYLVHTQRFEGPLGLLLYLIRKEEMDIFDINMVEITRQYLAYIRTMKELDLEVAGEFVAMAATLLYIKSRMLLPQYGDDGEVIEAEDPRKELVQKLLEYRRFQDASKDLYKRPLLNRDVWQRGLREDFMGGEDGEADGEIILEEDGLFSLIGSYRRALRQMKKSVHRVRAKAQSIGSRIMEMKDRLLVGQRVLMQDLVTADGGEKRNQLLITFLSILELGRMGFVSLFQGEVYSGIYIEAKKPIEGNVLERVQEFETPDADRIADLLFAEAEENQENSDAEPNEEASAEEGFELGRAIAASAAESSRAPGTELEDLDAATDAEIDAAEAELL